MMFVVLVGLVASIGVLSLRRPGPRVRNRPGRRRLGPGIPATIAAASDGSIDGDEGDFGWDGAGYDGGSYDGGYDAGGSDYGGDGGCGSDGGSCS
jgi:hypothetical protein